MTTGKIFLVTGGGGFLGGAIVRMLAARGERVRTLSRGDYPELRHLGVELIRGDLADPQAVDKACAGVEAVFHTAAKPGDEWGTYAEYYRTNVQGTLNIIEACRKRGVERLIYTSSPSVVFNGRDMEGDDESAPYSRRFENLYSRTKAMAEQAVLEAARNGLAAVALRPHLIWGPGDPHLVPGVLARAASLRRVGDGRNKVDTIYIDDAARAHLQAEESLRNNPALSGRVYFISQDEPIALWDMIDKILAAGNLPPVSGTISPGLLWTIGAILEGVYFVLRIKKQPMMTRFAASALSTAHWYNIDAAKRDLGFRPQVSMEEGLARLAQWLQDPGTAHADPAESIKGGHSGIKS